MKVSPTHTESISVLNQLLNNSQSMFEESTLNNHELREDYPVRNQTNPKLQRLSRYLWVNMFVYASVFPV